MAIRSYGEHRCILILRAYFDESGHSDDPRTQCVSIGGAISSLERWEKFEHKWKNVLAKFEISEFHMVDFSHSVGDFKKWEDDKEKRKTFIAELFDIMNTYIEGYIWATIIVEDFKLLTPETQQKLHDPYFPCFLNCVGRAAQLVEKLGEPEKVEIVFAQHPEFSPRALYFYNLCRFYPESPEFLRKWLGPISFDTPKDVVQLQAVDLVAYEINKIVNDYVLTGIERDRWPFEQIKKDLLTVQIYNYKMLVSEFGP